MLQFVGSTELIFDLNNNNSKRSDDDDTRPRLSGRQIARERLRALRKQRVKQRFVLMDGTEIETFSRFPSWQTPYS